MLLNTPFPLQFNLILKSLKSLKDKEVFKLLMKYKAGILNQEKFNEIIDKICFFLKS